MFNEPKYLPFCGGRYSVNETARIFDRDVVVIPELIDGVEYVTLDWVLGYQKYEKALVVLSAFGKIGFDKQYYDLIEVIYRDGDKRNCVPNNLLYRFKNGPIESSKPGFFLIAGYPRYLINKKGDIWDLLKEKETNWHLQRGPSLGTRREGYLSTYLHNTFGINGAFKHRMLCWVFKEAPPIYDLAVVNHKDGDKTNNDLDNLEWSTYTDNIKHAWDNGLRFNSRTRVLVRNLLTDEIRSFRSLREANASFGGKGGFYVTQRLNDQSGKLYPDFVLFKYDNDIPWPIVKEEIPKVPKGFKNLIVSRNVFTGEIILFDDLNRMESLIGIKPDTALDHARANKVIPYKGYNFRFLVNAKTWPKHSDKHLEIYKAKPLLPANGILVFDHETNKEEFDVTYEDTLKRLGLKQDHLQTLIFSGRRFKKRYSFKYFKFKESIEEESISSEAVTEGRETCSNGTFNDHRKLFAQSAIITPV